MTFIELLLAAKGGSKSAFEELFGRYKNLLRKYSVINGIFDDDLYQEQCMVFVHCIEIFCIIIKRFPQVFANLELIIRFFQMLFYVMPKYQTNQN